MNLYLLTNTRPFDKWDVYDSAVVAAPDEAIAKTIKPNPGRSIYGSGSWSDESQVECRLLGKAAKGTEQGVVLASFNAG